LPAVLDEAVSMHAPLFVVALAGVQSGRDRFRDQRGAIDELASPSGWSGAGNSAIIQMPAGLVFVFQALYGATCLDTDQLGEAVRLGLMSLSMERGLESRRLVDSPQLTGWPEALLGECTVAWKYLVEAPERWPWLSAVFGISEDYRIGLFAYYMSLHVLALAHTIASGESDTIGQTIDMNVPASFLIGNYDVSARAYRVLLRSQPSQIWESVNVSLDDMKRCWSGWLNQTAGWIQNVYHGPMRSGIVHEHLFDDLQT
jgi:hypothetical protein